MTVLLKTQKPMKECNISVSVCRFSDLPGVSCLRDSGKCFQVKAVTHKSTAERFNRSIQGEKDTLIKAACRRRPLVKDFLLLKQSTSLRVMILHATIRHNALD